MMNYYYPVFLVLSLTQFYGIFASKQSPKSFLVFALLLVWNTFFAGVFYERSK